MIILNKSIKKELIQNQKATPGVVSIICPPSDSGISFTVKNVNPNNTDNRENTILSVLFRDGIKYAAKKKIFANQEKKTAEWPSNPIHPINKALIPGVLSALNTGRKQAIT